MRHLDFSDVANGLAVTISVGNVVGENVTEPLDRILRRLDQALYPAKHGGRDRVVGAEPATAA